MKWFNTIKKNAKLDSSKEINRLTARNFELTSDIGKKVLEISQKIDVIIKLKADVDREVKQRDEFEKKYNKLKAEAVSFYKNDLLEVSLKIIGSILREEKPKDAWLEQQIASQNRLAGLQPEAQTGRFQQRYSDSLGLGGLLGL